MEFVLLPADRKWLERRIAQLEKSLKELGSEFEEVFSQSSETWHDNAPFEAVAHKQALLVAERLGFKQILRKATFDLPKITPGTVGIASMLTLGKNGTSHAFFIAGSWAHHTGQIVDGALVVSCDSPIAKAVIGKKVGEATDFGTIEQLN